jgi:mannose-6-phosphate isomerase-like protein (cupin superfamily)
LKVAFDGSIDYDRRLRAAFSSFQELGMNATTRGGVLSFTAAQSRIPGPSGERSVSALKRGTLDVVLGLPQAPNVQTPHTQDEMYFVVRGRGVFVYDDNKSTFEPGDILFVAAGAEHHYEDFSEDLALWRIFYGPEGGELPA